MLAEATPALLRYEDPDHGTALEMRNEAHTPRLDFYSQPRDGGSVKIAEDDRMWATIQALAACGFFDQERTSHPALRPGSESITLQAAGRTWVRRAWDTNPSPFPVFLEVLRAAYDSTPQNQAMSSTATQDLLRRAAQGGLR